MRGAGICSKYAAKQGMWGIAAVLLMFFTGFCLSINVKAADAPAVTKVQLINSTDIEIYWSEEVEGAGWVESQYVNNQLVKQEQNYSITVDGTDNPINYWYWEDYGQELKGIVYFNERNQYFPENPDIPKTSIQLYYPIENLTNLPEIKLTIKGNKIKSKATGTYVPEQTITVSTYEPYYQKERTLDCGVKVLGSAKVRDEAMDTAVEMLKIILANESVAERMGNAGCMLGIYGEGENAFDIPEHRFSYDENGRLDVEGFGGTQLASIRDANVLRLKTGSYTTGYPDESILTHEFAHTVQEFGLTDEQKQEIHNIYEAAIAAGKWTASDGLTYAGSNEYEYFATLSAIWFNVMDDTYDGSWIKDGRGPVNTRAELKVYDRAAYDFLSTIYVSDQYLPSPWENGSVPNNYVYPGSEKDPVVNNYKVTFVYGNGKANVNRIVKEGNRVSVPSAPKKKNYLFKGWYQGLKKYNFSSKIKKNITLQAKWDKVKKPGKTAVKSLKVKKGRKVLVTIKKLKNADGYKITYAKNKKLTKSRKSVYTLSLKKVLKLKNGTYYIGIQAYRKDSTGRKMLGKMSASKKVTVKK